MNKIYLDESGSTGADVLNAQQPIYVLSAIDLSEEIAREVFSEVFGNTNGREIKSSNLFRRNRYDDIIKVHDLIRQYGGSFYSVAMDKKYMAICKFVDEVFEPLFRLNGVDIRADGTARSTANLLSMFSRVEDYESQFDNLLNCFITAIKKKDDDSALALIRCFGVFQEIGIDDMVLPFPAEYVYDVTRGTLRSEHVTADLTSTTFLSLIMSLETNMEDPYHIIHDESNTLLNGLRTIMALASDGEASPTFTFGQNSISFPLKFNGFDFMDSRHSKSIQLADIISGTLMRITKNRIYENGDMRDFHDKVVEKYDPHKLTMTNFHNEDISRVSNDSISGFNDHFMGILRRS